MCIFMFFSQCNWVMVLIGIPCIQQAIQHKLLCAENGMVIMLVDYPPLKNNIVPELDDDYFHANLQLFPFYNDVQRDQRDNLC